MEQVKKPDFREEFTAKVIDAIERGEKLPWERSWTGSGSPRNAISDKAYNGANRLMPGMEMMDNDRTDPRYVTFKQAVDLGGAVRKGESGTQIERFDTTQFWQRKDVQVTHHGKPVDVEDVTGFQATLKAGNKVTVGELSAQHNDKEYTWGEARMLLNTGYSKVFTVFNVEQCDGLEKLPPLAKLAEVTTDARFDFITSAMKRDGLKKEHGAGIACYSPTKDAVRLPEAGDFKTAGDYQSVALHEIGHATGAEHRLNRDGVTGNHQFGSPAYAKEELRAELTSVFIAMETGINRSRDEQHTAYLQSWASALKESKHEIFKAAADASKAVEYIKERELAVVKEVSAPMVKVAKQKQAGISL
jgi:antirestriction protein ArdC